MGGDPKGSECRMTGFWALPTAEVVFDRTKSLGLEELGGGGGGRDLPVSLGGAGGGPPLLVSLVSSSLPLVKSISGSGDAITFVLITAGTSDWILKRTRQ